MGETSRTVELIREVLNLFYVKQMADFVTMFHYLFYWPLLFPRSSRNYAIKQLLAKKVPNLGTFFGHSFLLVPGKGNKVWLLSCRDSTEKREQFGNYCL